MKHCVNSAAAAEDDEDDDDATASWSLIYQTIIFALVSVRFYSAARSLSNTWIKKWKVIKMNRNMKKFQDANYIKTNKNRKNPKEGITKKKKDLGFPVG